MKFRIDIKNSKPYRLLLLIIFSAIFISSCEKDDVQSGSQEVALHSFGPSGVKHGDKIKFIGNNLDKVTSIVLPGIELTSSQFVSQTPEVIELIVPMEAEAGKVILKTASGGIESKTMLNFLVPVEIESITAESRPGDNITIKGKMVNWIETVQFNDKIVVTEFVSKSLTEVVVKVPENAQTGFLFFLGAGTKPTIFVTVQEVKITLPAVTGYSPASVKHTADLTIIGTDLDLVDTIVFAGNKSVTQFVSKSRTEIVVKVPVGTLDGPIVLKQKSPVKVTTTVPVKITLPVGTDISPKPAIPGTNDLTITGTDLDLIATLTLPGIATPIPASAFKEHTSTKIVLALPTDGKAGGIEYKTIHGYVKGLGLTVVLPGAGPAPLAAVIFDDALKNGFSDWGYGGATDKANTENPRVGTISAKKTFTGWDAIRFAGATTLSTTGRTHVVFSVYGGAGMNNKEANLIINDSWGIKKFNIKEGEWVEFTFPISELGNPATINDWGIQCGTAGIIYVDHVGLR